MKQFARYSFAFYSPGYCSSKLQCATKFSKSLRELYPSIAPNDIDRPLLLRYLGYLSASGIARSHQKNLIVGLRIILEFCAREKWLPITTERLIFDHEIPQTEKLLPRYIPDDVLNQLNRNLDGLPGHYMRMTLILQECGLRIGELLSMPFDCLQQDARGAWYLRYFQWKLDQEHTIPVSVEIARVIQEQQSETKSKWGPHAHKYLFPTAKGKVYGGYSFGTAINRLAYRRKIVGPNGRIFHFQSHQFRHTVGTRMINLDVPQHIIQRDLGHKTPEMTNRYAHIHDKTLRAKLEDFLGKRTVDITGKAIEQRPPVESSGLEWFSRSVLAQALPNRYCAIPLAAGPCPHPNACLTCSHFRTDSSFLKIHKAELAKTQEVVEKAQANGWVRQLEMNERKKVSLEAIVCALEGSNAKEEAEHCGITAKCTEAPRCNLPKGESGNKLTPAREQSHQL